MPKKKDTVWPGPKPKKYRLRRAIRRWLFKDVGLSMPDMSRENAETWVRFANGLHTSGKAVFDPRQKGA